MRDEILLSVAEATRLGERARRRKEGIPVDRAVYDQLRALIARRRPAAPGAARGR